MFNRVAAEGRPALMLFVTAGFPDPEATLELVPALVEAGADLIELGVPFSDPMADGVTIQDSSYHALRHGVSLAHCLEMVASLRSRLPDTPMLLMGYYNPLFKYGLSSFATRARQVELDAVIAADLPEEEADPLRRELSPRGIHLIPLFAPTSTDARIEAGCRAASGFVYCVSLTGVTGSREEVGAGVFPLVRRVRKHTSLPVAVGFGISRREHVESVGREADAVVVGSALIGALMGAPRGRLVTEARRFVAELGGSSRSPVGEGKG